MIPRAKIGLSVSGFVTQTPDAPLWTRALIVESLAPHSRSALWERDQPQEIAASTAAPRTARALSIYVVDDLPQLTSLYTIVLESAGYVVTAFNDRAAALAALKVETMKPDLLITDFLGLSMPVELFARQCHAVHPTLRLLMASGFLQTDARVAEVKFDGFIQKPFTVDELLWEVKATLTAG